MSADILYLEDDKNAYINVEMNVHNTLFLSIDAPDGGPGHFILDPDVEGFKKAEQIISALQEWISHSKE